MERGRQSRPAQAERSLPEQTQPRSSSYLLYERVLLPIFFCITVGGRGVHVEQPGSSPVQSTRRRSLNTQSLSALFCSTASPQQGTALRFHPAAGKSRTIGREVWLQSFYFLKSISFCYSPTAPHSGGRLKLHISDGTFNLGCCHRHSCLSRGHQTELLKKLYQDLEVEESHPDPAPLPPPPLRVETPELGTVGPVNRPERLQVFGALLRVLVLFCDVKEHFHT